MTLEWIAGFLTGVAYMAVGIFAIASVTDPEGEDDAKDAAKHFPLPVIAAITTLALVLWPVAVLLMKEDGE